MAQPDDVEVAAGAWTLLTSSDVSGGVTFQNKSQNHVLVMGTVGAVAPTDENGAIRYEGFEGERNVSLSELWPAIAATRLYVYAPYGAKMMVSF